MARTDFGPPDYRALMPPIIKENYGKWKYHTVPRPGVLKHVSRTGVVLHTVRVASPRLVSSEFIRDICDIAEKHCDGFLRFTTRNNIEFLVSDESKLQPLLDELEAKDYLIGGVGLSISNVIHTQGWIHCKCAVTDASGITKSIMDEMVDYFTGKKQVPAKLRIAVSCCINMCGASYCADIGIVGIHRNIPVIDDELASKICEVPSTLAACPVGALRPKPQANSVQINPDRCIKCGKCTFACPAIKIMDPVNDGVSIWVGGKVANARTAPMYSRLAIPFINNNPPRWPEVADAVKHLVEVWAANARDGERMGEWIGRIGWERFFKLTDLPFTDKHIDNFTHATTTFRSTTQFKF